MAHLASTFASYQTFLGMAEEIYAVDLTALNNSGVKGSAIAAIGPVEDDGAQYINVAIAVTGMEANVPVPQHIHGLFDGDGNPVDSTTPDILSDADGDGMVEVLEGVGSYGDVLLPLQTADGPPMTNADGDFVFIQSFNLNDPTPFFSPVTSTQYSGDDVRQLDLREIVLHGVTVPDGVGDGTGGEVDGGVNGFIPILPAAAGELERVAFEDAVRILNMQRDVAAISTMLPDGGATFDGGEGNDDLFGGNGPDAITGGGGNDLISGGAGNDTLTGNAGQDFVDGDEGDDMIMAGDDDANIPNASDFGASGALPSSAYDNSYAGGAGNDTIMGGAGDDIITGDDESRVSSALGTPFDAAADGSDVIMGGAGNDEIHTGSWGDGDDGLGNTHTGMMGDTAYGGDGNDILRGAGGGDVLQGDAGNDNIGGGGGNDTIAGNDGDDVLMGDAGDDLIGSGAGNDLARGGTGNDSIGGGAGNDTVLGGDGSDVIGGGMGDDMLYGEVGNDVVNGGSGNDVMSGGSGNDTMGAGDGNDVVIGDAGNDALGGGAGNDTLYGNDGNDAIGGGTGDDVVIGDAGNDFLAGGAGDDLLSGGVGNDTLNGGTGDDVLEGGAGGDLFVFNITAGDYDQVVDFEDGVDMLQFRGVAGGLGAVSVSEVFVPNADSSVTVNTVLSYNGHDVMLNNVAAASLTAEDFIFV